MKNILTLLAVIALVSPAYAGPSHDHGESAFAGGGAPVTHFELNEAQMQNLDIRFEPVQRLPIQDTVDMLTFTELLPEKHATISPRASPVTCSAHRQSRRRHWSRDMTTNPSPTMNGAIRDRF